MDNFKPENFGERWIRYIVQSFPENSWNRYSPFICVVFAAFFGYFSIQDIKSPAIIFVVIFLFMAIIYFERWHFSCILRKQQAQIDSLNKELNSIAPPK
jgi:hypothetical protein